MADICDIYAEISENNERVFAAFQAVYSAPQEEQAALHEKATSLFNQVKAENEKLANKAAEAGEKLKGTEISCEVSPELGITVEKAVFASVSAQPQFANIVIEAKTAGEAASKPYFLFKDKDGNVVYKTLGSASNGKVSVNFRITVLKGAGFANTLASVCSLEIVPYSGSGSVTGSASGSAAVESDAAASEEEPVEPAYIGETGSDAGGESVVVDGVVIKKGANLVETLRKCKRITWDYNADFGLTVTIGNVWIVIDDNNLTSKGKEIVNAIPSDIADNIDFSIDYIKTSAKIESFEQ